MRGLGASPLHAVLVSLGIQVTLVWFPSRGFISISYSVHEPVKPWALSSVWGGLIQFQCL